MGLGVIGVQRQRLLMAGDGLVEAPCLLQRGAQAGVRTGVVRVERQRLAVAGLGFVQAVQFVKGYAQVGVVSASSGTIDRAFW